MGELVLLRHGETEWSRAGRHTGRTDVALTPYGEEQARAAGELLAGRKFALVLTSPLQRAMRTAALAGLGHAVVDPDLVEWDYGGYEGLTTQQIRASGRPGWGIFRDGVVPGDPSRSGPGSSPGESLADVAARAARVLARVTPVLDEGDVAVVSHGHALRVLTSVWLQRPPDLGAQLVLGAGSVSVLGEEHGTPAILGWNRQGGDVVRDG
jgi:broad specificity phosphatase PhoE